MTAPPDTPKPSEFPPREIWVWIDGEGYYEVRDEQPNKVAERYILAPSPQESHKLAEELEHRYRIWRAQPFEDDRDEQQDLFDLFVMNFPKVLAALRSSPSEQTSEDKPNG